MKAPLALLLAPALALAAEPPVPQFRAVTLDGKIQIGYGLAIADVDGDKAPDVLLADKKQFVWYRNPGKDKAGDPAAWTKHLLAENLTEKDNVCIAAQDIDGDGKAEVAVGAEWNPGDTAKSGAVFYLQAPAARTQPWTPIRFPEVEPTTHRMRWTQFGDGKWGLVVVPLHGRGNKNGEGAPVNILLYRPPVGDLRGPWKSEVLNATLHQTHNFTRFPYLTPAGRPLTESALLFAGREGFAAVVPNGPDWVRATPQVPADMAGGIGEVRVGSLVNGVQFITTVEPMHGHALAVYVPEKAATGVGPLARRLLTDRLVDGHALACGNVLGGFPGVTASEQIVVGWRGKPGQAGSTTGVAVWASLDPQGEKWRETVIDPDGMACEDLLLADLDADGQLDIVAAGRATKNVKIYFNETPTAPPRIFTEPPVGKPLPPLKPAPPK